MEDISVFLKKENIPDESTLKDKLDDTFLLWKRIEEMVLSKYPQANPEWNFPGKKYGWSFRIKDKKRAIIYLLPREGYFKVAFVFGERAVEKIVASGITSSIKEKLLQAKKYAEGRGIRIDIKNDELFKDIENLVDIKLNT